MKIGINGFGRIGRLILRSALARNVDLDVVAINDRGNAQINAHLFQFDSTYGPFLGHVKAEDDRIIIDGQSISIVSHLNPLDIPWRELGVAVWVAVPANAVQQSLLLVGKEHYPCQPISCVIDGPSCRKAQFRSDVCHRLSAGLGEPHRLALKLLRRSLLDIGHEPCPPPDRIDPQLSLLHETGVNRRLSSAFSNRRKVSP